MDVANKNILIVGFARSGLAAANFLLARRARVTITDIKPESVLKEWIAQLISPADLSLGAHRVDDFLNADFIVLSPGVPASLPPLRAAAERGIPIYSEVELAYRFLEGDVIGITGSNGKTTTTALIGELLRASGREVVVAGNIGSPLMQWAKKKSAEGRMTYVVELSSFQLETIETFHCHVAVVLNVSPDHQDRYTGLEDYVAAKERIFLNQTKDDYAVLNADNAWTQQMGERRNSRVVFFSRTCPLKQGFFVDKDTIRVNWLDQNYTLLPVSEIQLKGNHNVENVLAAAAVGTLCRVEPEIMRETFRSFSGVEHRLEPVGEVQGVLFFNDSKATNTDSAAYAIQAFSQPLLLIMGGRDKGADFRTLRSLIQEKVKLLILIGEAADKISDAVRGAVPIFRARDMENAVRAAFGSAAAGDVVLLSPGCASFDMFENFEHRGRVFKEAVKNLKGEHP